MLEPYSIWLGKGNYQKKITHGPGLSSDLVLNIEIKNKQPYLDILNNLRKGLQSTQKKENQAKT